MWTVLDALACKSIHLESGITIVITTGHWPNLHTRSACICALLTLSSTCCISSVHEDYTACRPTSHIFSRTKNCTWTLFWVNQYKTNQQIIKGSEQIIKWKRTIAHSKHTKNNIIGFQNNVCAQPSLFQIIETTIANEILSLLNHPDVNSKLCAIIFNTKEEF